MVGAEVDVDVLSDADEVDVGGVDDISINEPGTNQETNKYFIRKTLLQLACLARQLARAACKQTNVETYERMHSKG